MTSFDNLERFNHLYSEIESLYHEAAQRLGLSDSAMQILYAVRTEKRPCSMSDIARLTGISKQTLHSSIRNLERNGILCLQRGAGRSAALHLTPEGERLVQARVDPLLSAEADIYRSWSEQETEAFFSLLSKYRAALKERIETLSPAPDCGPSSPSIQEDL
ncbi:MAG: MarR family transcriptional regulator [Clostridia bacterium]|nr:MarR family transcriptional regulator [Clostridia bacterium]